MVSSRLSNVRLPITSMTALGSLPVFSSGSGDGGLAGFFSDRLGGGGGAIGGLGAGGLLGGWDGGTGGSGADGDALRSFGSDGGGGGGGAGGSFGPDSSWERFEPEMPSCLRMGGSADGRLKGLLSESKLSAVALSLPPKDGGSITKCEPSDG